MRIRLMVLLLGVILCAISLSGYERLATAQEQATANTQLDKLPPALRQQGQAILSQSNEGERARLAADLARKDAAAVMEFLLAVLAADPSPQVRIAIIDRLGRSS